MAADANAVYTTLPIRGIINEVDPDFGWKRIVAPAYTFSNGRKFFTRETPGQPYDWNDDNVGGNGTYHAP